MIDNLAACTRARLSITRAHTQNTLISISSYLHDISHRRLVMIMASCINHIKKSTTRQDPKQILHSQEGTNVEANGAGVHHGQCAKSNHSLSGHWVLPAHILLLCKCTVLDAGLRRTTGWLMCSLCKARFAGIAQRYRSRAACQAKLCPFMLLPVEMKTYEAASKMYGPMAAQYA